MKNDTPDTGTASHPKRLGAKSRLFLLAIISLAILILIISMVQDYHIQVYQRKAETEQMELHEQLAQARKQLESTQTQLEITQTRLEQNQQEENTPQPSTLISSWMVDLLKRQGLDDPLQDIVSDLMQHPELIPYDGVLGGTMGFYSPEGIHVLNTRWVMAYFEDGHISGQMLLRYQITDDVRIEWEVLDSFLN